MVHQHDHPGHHHDHRRAGQRRLLIVLVLAGGYMLAEVIGGLLTGSLALLADAGHMLSDVASLGLSLFAMWIARRPGPPQRTYGYYRAEILAALVNGSALVVVAIFIFKEACERFTDPPPVAGAAMLAIAAGGLGVNLAGLWILHEHREAGLNVRGAWLHVLSDALGSVGAMTAGVLIWAFGWMWADPLISVVIAGLVVYSAWRLLAETVAVLMEAAPRGIDVDEVREAMSAVPGVLEVHDLHVWTITSGLESLSAHVVASEAADDHQVLSALRRMLHDRFGIHHITIQIEPEDFAEERPVV